MKKNNLLKIKSVLAVACVAVLITFATASLASCSKIVKDENGFCLDGASAIKTAKKEDKNILIVATMKGDDLFSNDLVDLVLKDNRFQEEIGSKYTVLLTDFSQNAYAATVFNDESTKEERKQAEKRAEIMQKNTLLASRLNLQLTPAIYIMSKEMYYITQLDFTTDQISNYDSFKELLEKAQPQVDEYNEKIAAISKGSKTERLTAIDQLYESTEAYYMPFIADLIDQYIKLDKKNETGLVSKYIVAKADIESSNFFLGGDIASAVKIYADAAKDMRLSPEHRQNCYYMAAYILAVSNSSDYKTMETYLKSALDAYPEGPNVQTIELVLSKIEGILASQPAAEVETAE